jgi:protein TonB
MKRHTPSLFVSLLVHAFFAVLVFSTIEYAVKISDEKKEKRVCLKLQCVKPHKEAVQKPITKAVTPPKPLKKIKPKPKKKPPKKIIKKVKPKVIEKVKEEVKKEELMQKIPQKVVEQKPLEVKELKPEPKEEEQGSAKEVCSKEKVYLDKHLKEIIKLLSENLYYPRSARKRGIEGVVKVYFTLNKDASVENIQVLSSQSDILSRAAIKTIEDLSKEFPKPQEVLMLKVPIEYRLR